MSSDEPTSRRPRILHCVTHLALGGAERVAMSIVETLRTDFDFGMYAVRGVTDREVGPQLKRQLDELSIPLYTGSQVPMRYGGMLTGAFGFSRAVRAFEPDVIHLHTEIPEASYATMVTLNRAARQIPVVRTIHNSQIWQFSPALGRWCDRQLANAVVAGVSNGAVDAFHRLRGESGTPAPSEAPVTIYNGVGTPRARRVARAPGEAIRVVFGGRFEDQKGTDLIAEILAAVKLPTQRRAHLTLFGAGAHESVLRSLAARPPAGWTIELRAPVSDFAEQLRHFDLMIVPSRFEGLCLVAVEALLAGVPIISTDAPGLRETLPANYPWRATPGDAGSFARALTTACAEDRRWDEVAAAGYAFAQKRFALDIMASAYRRLYQTALCHG